MLSTDIWFWHSHANKFKTMWRENRPIIRSTIQSTSRKDETCMLHVQANELYSILFYPITLGGRRGTTDEFATIPFHLDLFSAALFELAKSIPVHSLILFPTSSSVCLFFFFLSLCPEGLSLLNQKTLRHGQTILAFVSWPGSGVRHILQWLLGSFYEPPHW